MTENAARGPTDGADVRPVDQELRCLRDLKHEYRMLQVTAEHQAVMIQQLQTVVAAYSQVAEIRKNTEAKLKKENEKEGSGWCNMSFLLGLLAISLMTYVSMSAAASERAGKA